MHSCPEYAPLPRFSVFRHASFSAPPLQQAVNPAHMCHCCCQPTLTDHSHTPLTARKTAAPCTVAQNMHPCQVSACSAMLRFQPPPLGSCKPCTLTARSRHRCCQPTCTDHSHTLLAAQQAAAPCIVAQNMTPCRVSACSALCYVQTIPHSRPVNPRTNAPLLLPTHPSRLTPPHPVQLGCAMRTSPLLVWPTSAISS
jgi:hypothetical protein